MAPVETVKIKGDVKAGEPAVIIINQEDFDEKVHELATDKDIAAAERAAAENAPVAPDAEDLLKKTKAELVAIAEEKNISVVPDDMTKQQIVDAIIGK